MIMDTFETLKKEFTDNGFTIEDDMFTFERVSYNTMNINGRTFKQPQKSIFKMKYISEGSLSDPDSSESSPIYQFDVLNNNDEPVVTVCISKFEDLNALL